MLKDQSKAEETEASTATMIKVQPISITGPGTAKNSDVPAESLERQTVYDRNTISQESEFLQEFIVDQELTSSLLSGPQPCSLPNGMFNCLQRFILSPNSTSLLLIGPNDTCYPSDMSSVAASIKSVLSQAGPKVIFHFCALPSYKRPGISKEESRLVSLLYSLIRQLIRNLNSQFESTIDLTRECFATLDGSTAAWPAALKLFEDLVSLSAPYIICIIDGIDWADYGAGSDRCGELWATIDKGYEGTGGPRF